MKYQVMPDLTPVEYEILKSDIAANGVLVPVEVDEHGELLDGHHRVRAWQELRAEGLNIADYPRLIRGGWTEEQKRNHARRLNVVRRHLSKEQRDQLMIDMRRDGMSYRAIAEAVGVSHETARSAVANTTVKNLTVDLPDRILGKDGKMRPAHRFVSPESPDDTDEYLEQLADDPDGYEWSDEQPEATPTAKPHVSHNSGNNEWYTPAEYIDAARQVMGEIDLDPASNPTANTVVNAKVFYTAGDDGLARDWSGNVWMNPPYASELVKQFAAKMARHWRAGDISEAIVLVNNATETEWFRTLIDCATAVAFPHSRVKFWQPNGEPGSPLQGQALIYLGDNPTGFRTAFRHLAWSARI